MRRRMKEHLTDDEETYMEMYETLESLKDDVDEIEFQYASTLETTMDELFGDKRIAVVDKFFLIVDNMKVNSIRKSDGNILISAVDIYGIKKEFAFHNLTLKEQHNIVSFFLFVCLSVSSAKFPKTEDEKKEDKKKENKEEPKPEPAKITEKKPDRVIDEDAFWKLVEDVKWSTLCDYTNVPDIPAKQKVQRLGYSDSELKEFLNICMKVRQDLYDNIMIELKDDNLLPGVILEICGHIIGLGLDAYSDVFCNPSDFRDYEKSYKSGFLHCFEP